MQVGMVDRQAIRRRWEAVGSKLDERGRRMLRPGKRLWRMGWPRGSLGDHGLARVDHRPRQEKLDAAPLPKGRVRRDGAGRPDLFERDGHAVEDLLGVIEPVTLGDPVRPMLWVSKSHEKLAGALQKKGHEVSASSVRGCSRHSATVGNRTGRRTRARSIPTAMRNSSTSTQRPSRRRPRDSPSSRSTPRRKS